MQRTILKVFRNIIFLVLFDSQCSSLVSDPRLFFFFVIIQLLLFPPSRTSQEYATIGKREGSPVICDWVQALCCSVQKSYVAQIFLVESWGLLPTLIWFRNMLTRVLIHFDWFQFRREKGEVEIDDCLNCSIHFDLISSRPSIFNTKNIFFVASLRFQSCMRMSRLYPIVN